MAMIKKWHYQLVPPHNHRANAAERGIQSFQNHFKVGLASLDPNFPIAEWDHLLTQAFLTLNLLRTANSNPRLSAHAYLFRQFDFNATPLAPRLAFFPHTLPFPKVSTDDFLRQVAMDIVYQSD